MKLEAVSRIKAHQRYYVDGKRVPGVTTIITGLLAKPALYRWNNKMGLQGIDTSKYVDKMADAGTLAHMMVAAHWCGSKLSQDELDSFTVEQQRLADNAFLSYLEWEKGKDIHVLTRPMGGTFAEERCVELQLASHEHRYGGTIDCIAAINGVVTILDLKTSRAIYDEMLYQVAAYWQLARENGWEAEAIRILQIGRGEDEDWSEKIIRRPKIERYWNVFQGLLDAYKAIREAKK